MKDLLSSVVREAFEADSERFIETVQTVTTLLESENGRMNGLTILGRLVQLEQSGNALIVGDLHGDMETLADILVQSHIVLRMQKNLQTRLVFLGDYGDRGPLSAEVYYTVLKLKLVFPTQVILMRGNHEGPKTLPFQPHDLLVQFQGRFGSKASDLYDALRDLWETLYVSVIVKQHYLMLHGGVPTNLGTAEDLAFAHSMFPEYDLLEDILWSDPDDSVDESEPSPRGAGKLFGEKLTSCVLGKLDLRVLVRSHEFCEDGYRINHKGKILTLFSRKGPPYFNVRGAYLDVNLSEQVTDATQLVKHIRFV